MKAKIFVNGALVGNHENPVALVESIREKRRQGIISGTPRACARPAAC